VSRAGTPTTTRLLRLCRIMFLVDASRVCLCPPEGYRWSATTTPAWSHSMISTGHQFFHVRQEPRRHNLRTGETVFRAFHHVPPFRDQHPVRKQPGCRWHSPIIRPVGPDPCLLQGAQLLATVPVCVRLAAGWTREVNLIAATEDRHHRRSRFYWLRRCPRPRGPGT
jgi:hypothetical protein